MEEYDQIINEITSGLTGDSKRDILYLLQKSEEFKDFQDSPRILKIIGRLIVGLFPDDPTPEISEILYGSEMGVFSLMEEVRFNQEQKNYSKALYLIQPLIARLDALNVCIEDQENLYLSFENDIEALIYRYIYDPPKETVQPPYPMSEIYYTYGSILVELKQWNEARSALMEALRWNPVSARAALGLTETFKYYRKLTEFFNLTKETLRYCYTPEDMAHCYRNLGWYFVEKKQYDEASACYIVSLQYEDSPVVEDERKLIKERTGNDIKNLSIDEIVTIFTAFDIPLHADKSVTGLIRTYATYLKEHNKVHQSHILYQTLYRLTQDEEIGELMDETDDSIPHPKKEENKVVEIDDIKLNFDVEYSRMYSENDDNDKDVTMMKLTDESSCLVKCTTVNKKEGMKLKCDRAMIRKIHEKLTEEQGLIEAGSGTTKGGKNYSYFILKSGDGLQKKEYDFTLHIEEKKNLAEITGWFKEEKSGDVRENVIFESMIRRGLIKMDGNTIKGWAKDPYDEHYKKGNLMTRAEDKTYDSLFIEHPLSQCRMLIKELTEIN